MTGRVLKLYKGAIKNDQFTIDMYNADRDKPPKSIFDGNEVKIAYASFYYGWLVAKYGNEWESNI